MFIPLIWKIQIDIWCTEQQTLNLQSINRSASGATGQRAILYPALFESAF